LANHLRLVIMMFDFDYVIFACLVTVAYSTYCTNSDFDAYKTCLTTANPKPDMAQIQAQSDACYTQYGCPIPVRNQNNTHNNNGSSSEEHDGKWKEGKHGKGKDGKGKDGKGKDGKGKDGKGKDGKGKDGTGDHHEWSHVNKTVLKQCKKQQRESILSLVEKCVQQNITGFNLTKYEEHKRGGHGHGHEGKGGHHSKGHMNDTTCPLRRNVSECRNNVMEQIFNKTKHCEAEISCKITNCDVNATQVVVCDCAKGIPKASRDQIRSTFLQCIGVNVTAESQPSTQPGNADKSAGKEGKWKGKGKMGGKGHDGEFEMFCGNEHIRSSCGSAHHEGTRGNSNHHDGNKHNNKEHH